jgi:hypothetical protein
VDLLLVNPVENDNIVEVTPTDEVLKVKNFSYFKVKLSKILKIKKNGLAIAPLVTDRLGDNLRLESDIRLYEVDQSSDTE